VSIDDLLFKSNVVGIVLFKPFISGFWSREQFEMVDVADLLVRRLRDQDTIGRAESGR
jgi:hypothetical protein